MKKFLKLLPLLLLQFVARAQEHGNEWINYSQNYYSFKIAQTGVFRIDYATLQSSGIPVNSFSSANMQLVGRDKEVPIYVVDGGDNSMDPGDYFLFYAKKNDGWLDSLTYKVPEDIANPDYSLYNDTICYFFTWNNQTTNLRFTQDSDINYTGYGPAASFVVKEISSNFTGAYVDGLAEGSAKGSIYSPGEGWCYGELNINAGPDATWNLTVPSINPYMGTGAPNPVFHVSSTANSNATYTGAGNHHLRISLGSPDYLLIDEVWEGYKHTKFDSVFPQSVLAAGATGLKYQVINDQGAAADRQSLAYWRLRYARLPNANSAVLDEFYVPNNTSFTKSFVQLQDLGGSSPMAFYFGNGYKALACTPNGAFDNMIVPNNPSGTQSRVIAFDMSTVASIAGLTPVNGTGQFTDYESMNLEEALLLVYHPSMLASSQAYQSYRQSIAGGSYNALLVNVEELYLQYGGGIPKHILGIRRFVDHVYDVSTIKPVGLFLMGRGYTESQSMRTNPTTYAASLIPSFGNPSSDIAITAGLNGTFWEPLLATGRIACNTNAALQDYLDKIIEYEDAQNQTDVYDTPNKDWQKHILHFAGGGDYNQQQSFQSFMRAMEDIIEDTLFGGEVTFHYKTSSDPAIPDVVTTLADRISNGVSIMNFFGHALPPNGFDINVDDPNNWENQGKYPIVIGNSCYNGNIYSPAISTSERFVKPAHEGAIAFISSVFVGYDSPLNYYTNTLYRHMAGWSYGETLGEQMRRTIDSIQSPGTGGVIMETTCTQMSLNGDPMIKLNWHAKPEIELLPENVFFTPDQLNLTVDSIDVHVILTNLGRSVNETFNLTIRRDYPGNAPDAIYNFPIDKLNYKDTFVLRIPMQPNIGLGENVFTISADIPTNVIAEQYEEQTNNQVVKTLLINVDGILPTYPPDFAVVPRDSVAVKASTVNPIASPRTYVFELDVTDLYNTSEFRTFRTTDVGGVHEVRPDQWTTATGTPFPLVCQDSAVYFWRVAIDSSILDWREFSFQYIPGKEGWGQDHFFQFKKNDFSNIFYNRADSLREFETIDADTHHVVINVFNSYTIYNAWYLDGTLQDYATCGTTPSFHVFVLDPVTLQPWKTLYNGAGFDFGQYNVNGSCRARQELYFAFSQLDATHLASFENMITNEVPDGHYIGIYTPGSMQYQTINSLRPSVFTALENLGMQFDTTETNGAFGFFVKKGFPTTAQERHYPNTTNTNIGTCVVIDAPIVFADNVGFERTPFIGPSLDWKTVYWRRDSLEAPSGDSVSLHIEAYDANKVLTMTIDTMFTPIDSIIQLNNLVDAAIYPYIRLGVFYADETFITPAQVERLHVLYQPVPEAAIDGTTAYFISPDPDGLHEGENVQFAVDVVNVSDYNMDSLLIRYWVEDANRMRHYIPYPRQDSLLAGERFRDTITFSTIGYPGVNSLWMEVNPYIPGSTTITDQPEQFHFNNLLQLPFVVEGDDEHPILDVTFDGIHILNRDIVSPKTEILITLKDANPFLIMDDISDTTLFGIYITDPAGVQHRIPFMDNYGNHLLDWTPADPVTKKFRIIYNGDFLEDGIYQLLVQGTDRSGNLSGDLEYRINFEIVRESSITYLMNYPNPFSTSTRFVFTLTGSQEPTEMIIQIMTVTGKVVREITEDELGPIHIGRNITQYAWDGRDEFGDPLANGVYLYRVKAQIEGEEIKHRSTEADQHFTKEFGKMYLMR